MGSYFNVTKKEVFNKIAYYDNEFTSGDIISGDSGEGGDGTYTDDDILGSGEGTWEVGEFIGWTLKIAGQRYNILNNTEDTLTIKEDLTGVSSDYEIIPDITDDQIEGQIISDYSHICSFLPQKYLNLLNKVEGEILVEYADSSVSENYVITLGLGTAVESSIRVFRNVEGMYFNRFYTGYEVTGWTYDDEENTIIITDFNTGDKFYADYLHNLDICPAILTDLLAKMVARNIERVLYNFVRKDIDPRIKEDLEKIDKFLETLNDPKSDVGIAEFDMLNLYNETKITKTPSNRWGSIDIDDKTSDYDTDVDISNTWHIE